MAYQALAEGIREARTMGRPHLAAIGVVGLCWLLLRQGRFDECEALAASTADAIEPRLSKATAGELAVWGELLQRVASAAIRNNREDVAREARRMAATAANAVQVERADPNTQWAAFGPVTAGMKALEDRAVIGDHNGVLSGIDGLPRGAMGTRPDANNGNRHRLDVAMAHAQVGDHGDATAVLSGVRTDAPEWIRHQGLARDVVRLVLEKRKRTLTADIRDLADHLGVTG